MKLLINNKKYKVTLGGAKYLFNWNPEVVPDTPVVPDVPTYKLQKYECDISDWFTGDEITADSGYDGISEINLTSNWRYQEYQMARITYNGTRFGFEDSEDIFNQCTIDFTDTSTPIMEITSNDQLFGGTWKLTHIGPWESWVPDTLGIPDSTYNSFNYFLKFVNTSQLGATTTAYFGYDTNSYQVICIAVLNAGVYGLMDYKYDPAVTSGGYSTTSKLFDPSYTKVKISYQIN
jgi:hypothetical protein